ncbi:MAG TPA: dTDP-4-dehydrorhamnose 3,5-epimerase [Cyclobacteriaceae bacterium]|nr:dTDP-4-dehydrorhamnose 3,5-epimerase [Cyclobacteriaceae bacterium]
MKISPTGFADLYVLEPTVYTDPRGFFFESYNSETMQNLGINIDFVQDNQSFSKRGVLRGLHFQKNPHAQTKLVSVLAGKILDVVVDLRKGQPTFKKFFSVELSDENNLQLFVPKGFAHAFVVLSESASVLYKCDVHYSKSNEGGIRFDDPDLNIDWHVPVDQLTLSEKDLKLPFLRDLDYHF